MIMIGDGVPAIQAHSGTPPTRLADIDADGIAPQVVSLRRCSSDTARRAPRGDHDLRDPQRPRPEDLRPAPDRLLPMCQVPLQDPDTACEELDRCMAAGRARRGDRQPRRQP